MIIYSIKTHAIHLKQNATHLFYCAIPTNSLKSGSALIKFGSLQYWVSKHHRFNLDQKACANPQPMPNGITPLRIPRTCCFHTSYDVTNDPVQQITALLPHSLDPLYSLLKFFSVDISGINVN